MLGASHSHRYVAVSADPMEGWTDFRRSDQVAYVTVVHHRHTHSAFERHHHDADDSTVIALDGRSADAAAQDDGSSGGSASLVLALAGTLRVATAGWALVPWSTVQHSAFDSLPGDRLERPPRA